MEPATELINQFDIDLRWSKNLWSSYDQIISDLWPGSKIKHLSNEDRKTHSEILLDKNLAIDTIIEIDGQQISIQEKFRRNRALSDLSRRVKIGWPDFTIETKNAAGTQYEEPGEYDHLFAQYYFYGWATRDDLGFEKWILLDVPKLKEEIIKSGGLEAIGKKFFNCDHGSSEFYAIPICRLYPAGVRSYKNKYPMTLIHGQDTFF
jgi:hypothetical protein